MNTKRFAQMKEDAILINTSRGSLVDTDALIAALRSGHLGAAGLDVYEDEADLYFRDHSNDIICDDKLERLLTFPNVIVTGHQSFFTSDALETIAITTIKNMDDFTSGKTNENVVGSPRVSEV